MNLMASARISEIPTLGEQKESKQGRSRNAVPVPGSARRIGELAAQIEQGWRAESARTDGEFKRLWGIMQAATGGMLYTLLMNSATLDDADKQFVKYTKNRGS